MEDLNILKNCILFKDLDPEKVCPLLEGSIEEYAAGTVVIREEQRMDQLEILLSGAMQAVKLEMDGSKFMYQHLRPSFLVAGEVVCTKTRICLYEVSATENSRVWTCSCDMLHSPQLPTELRLALMQNLLYFVADQNIKKYHKIDALSVKSARARILKYLTAQAVRSGDNTFTIPFDRETMANYLCLNRSVLSHTLKKMEQEGIIAFHKNQFTIFDKKLSEQHTK